VLGAEGIEVEGEGGGGEQDASGYHSHARDALDGDWCINHGGWAPLLAFFVMEFPESVTKSAPSPPQYPFVRLMVWPAPGSEDTEFGVLMEREVGHGEAEVYAGV
jgi:hypothetical protein